MSQVLSLLKELDSEETLSLEKAKAIWQKMKQYTDYKLYVALLGTEIVGMFCLLICDNFGHGCVLMNFTSNWVLSNTALVL